MKIIVVFFAMSLLGWWILLYTHLTVNETESLPYHVFFCIRGLKPVRGDVVRVTRHPTIYTGNCSLTKRLLGLPGDIIEIRGDEVFVSEKSMGHLQAQTQSGKLLTPLKARVIPEGYVFLSGDHPRSFDSRYEEFGLVKARCIHGICWGLFKKEGSCKK